MRWYELARIVHFMGLIALFGSLMINMRAGAQLRAATQLDDARAWLGALLGARIMLHGGSGLLLISGIMMIALRWRGSFPFATIGMATLLLMWLLSVVGGRHLRSIQAATKGGHGPIPEGLRTIILAPRPWAVMAAINGAGAGVLFVMTWKPGWPGAIATILLASLAGALIANTSMRRQRGAPEASRLSSVP